jgi:hypothetical protein
MPSMTLEGEIKPGSPLSDKILEEVRRRVRFSERSFSTRRLQWRKAEDEIIAYLPESAADNRRRFQRENQGVPKYTTIKVPYTYAVVMALHTYVCSVFLSRTPIFQFDGRHGEGQQSVLAVEALHDYQVRVGRMLPVLYSWFYDAARYGVGIISLYWTEKVRRASEIQFTVDEFGNETKEQVTIEIPGYSGNEICNIQPRDWLPDPRLPMRDFQRGEFCGGRTKLSWLQIKEREKAGYYTNVKAIPRKLSPRFTDERDDDSQVERPDDEFAEFSGYTGANREHPDIVPIYEMFIELIPSDWGLGDSDYPEKWVFTCTADWTVVLGAQPHGAYHCQYPYHFIELEPDAYALSNRGMPEILSGVQQTLDWLLNSHFFNVRASLNNLLVVDPMRVVMKDITDPTPGGVIRLRAGAAAIPGDPVKQLQIGDVTRNHTNDFMQMIGVGERVSGINDQMLGAFTKTGRRTATEVRTSSVGGVSRQKVETEYMSCTGMDTLAQQMVQNSQQYHNSATTVKIVGNLANLAGYEWLNVGPDDIQGFFDFVPVDGTLPLDRFAQANLWKEIMVAANSVPAIAMEYSMAKIFAWTAQLAGLRNLDKFRVELGSPEQLAAQAQLGNVIPMRAGGRGGRNPNNLKQPGNGVGPIPIGGGGLGA